MVQITCKAANEYDVRCGTTTEQGGQFCPFHAARQRSGHVVPLSPPPDEIVFGWGIGRKLGDQLLCLGAVISQNDPEIKERNSQEQAQSYGRVPYDDRNRVFVKEGLDHVSILDVFTQMVNNYDVGEAHLRPKENGMYGLYIKFFLRKKSQPNSPLLEHVFKSIKDVANWRYCHVYDNPPKANLQILHIVEVVGRPQQGQSRPTRYVLTFSATEGWGAQKCFPVWKTLELPIGITGADYLRIIKKQQMGLGDYYASDMLVQPGFKVVTKPTTLKLAVSTVEELGFNQATPIGDILARIQTVGQLCPHSVGPELLHHVDAELQEDQWLVIGMAPITTHDNKKGIFALHKENRVLHLSSAGHSKPNLGLEPHHKFVFVVAN